MTPKEKYYEFLRKIVQMSFELEEETNDDPDENSWLYDVDQLRVFVEDLQENNHVRDKRVKNEI